MCISMRVCEIKDEALFFKMYFIDGYVPLWNHGRSLR